MNKCKLAALLLPIVNLLTFVFLPFVEAERVLLNEIRETVYVSSSAFSIGKVCLLTKEFTENGAVPSRYRDDIESWFGIMVIAIIVLVVFALIEMLLIAINSRRAFLLSAIGALFAIVIINNYDFPYVDVTMTTPNACLAIAAVAFIINNIAVSMHYRKLDIADAAAATVATVVTAQ